MAGKVLQAFCGLFLCSQVALAQVTTATIAGLVQDESGAVVPGATVTVKNLETGLARTVRTSENGRYQTPNLPPGSYEVRAELSGFRTEVRTGITLTVGREANVPFTLEVGDVAQSVVITGEAPLVETAAATVGGTVVPEQIQDLPLNARSIDRLVLLQPGVLLGRNSSGGTFDRSRANRIVVHGARPDQNNYTLDGTDINGPSNQAPGSVAGNFMGVDAIREFRVEANTYSAQSGRNAGGNVSIVTNSGTNHLHGTVFEYLRNDNFDAAKWETNRGGGVKPAYVRNQFGFSVGGPIRHDRTFFFGNYEGLRERLGQAIVSTVPTQTTRTGFLPNRQTGALEFVGVDPLVKPFLDLYPLPNGREFTFALPNGQLVPDGTGEWFGNYSQPTSENLFSVRVDHNFSDSDSFFTRYTGTNAERVFADALVTLPMSDTNHNQYVTLEEKHIFTPTLLNTFRVGFNRSFQIEKAVPAIDISHLPELVPGVKPLLGGGFAIGFSGGLSGWASSSAQNAPALTAFETYQWSDDLFKARGRHSLKWGGLLLWFRRTQNRSNEAAGSLGFTGGLANVLSGTLDSFETQLPGTESHRSMRQKMFAWYFQDDISLLPNLTLSVGLRHEFVTSPAEAQGKISNLVSIFDNQMTIGKLFDTPKDLFAPRFGFSWDPLKSGKTTIRGGFGVFYDYPLTNRWQTPLQNNPPFFGLATIRNVPIAQAYQRDVQSGAATLSLRPATLQGITTVYRYDFSIQRDLGAGIAFSLGYAASLGRHLPRRGDENSRIPVMQSDRTTFYPPTNLRFNPVWSSVRRLTYDTNSSYHGLLLSANKRFSKAASFQVSYTFSKSIDAGVGIEGGESSSSNFQTMDAYDWKRDRGVSEFSARHNLVASLSYELPFGAGGRLPVPGAWQYLVGGWQLNGIITLSAGLPFEVVNGFDRSGSLANPTHDRPNLIPGGNNNPVLGTPDLWFDLRQFQLQPAGVHGNLGRDTVTGPGLATVDFSVFKNIPLSRISEGFKVQFRAEFFNLSNRPNFSVPVRSVFQNAGAAINGSAGKIQTTDTTSRQVQFGLRLQF